MEDFKKEMDSEGRQNFSPKLQNGKPRKKSREEMEGNVP